MAGSREPLSTLLREGTRLGQLGRFDEAIHCLTQATQLAPECADGFYNLGVALRALRRHDEARQAFERAVQLNPHWATALYNLGNCYRDAKRSDDAIRCYEAALRSRPDFYKAANNLARMLADRGQRDRAERVWQSVLRRVPRYAPALFNLSRLRGDQKRYQEAIELMQRAVHARPQFAQYRLCLAELLYAAGNRQESIALANSLVQNLPVQASIAFRLASLLHRAGEDASALRVLERIVSPNTRAMRPLRLLANVLRQLGRFDESLTLADAIIAAHPASHEGWMLRGMTQLDLGDVDGTIAAHRKARELRPGDPRIATALATALHFARRHEESQAALDEALRLAPRFVPARMNNAFALLAEGDFRQGWREFEWRHLSSHGRLPSIDVPPWRGEPLASKRILVRTEQGLGDTFQFIRFTRALKALEARVVVQCQSAVAKLAATAPGVDQVIHRGEAIPDVDFQIPMLSLPGALKTTLATLDSQVPYLSVDARAHAHWQERVRSLGEFVVGIAWQGSRSYRGDQFRSAPLRYFDRLAQIPGVALVSLQKNEGVEQLRNIDFPVQVFEDLDAAEPFGDTAPLLRACDLVITTDTAIAHLAGALACPTWVALGYSAEWRWMRAGRTSPWYPTMRLYRQPKLGDWENLFSEIARDLALVSEENDVTLREEPAHQRAPLPVPVSPGELIDKVIILELKRAHLTDYVSAARVEAELRALADAYSSYLRDANAALLQTVDELRQINRKLWEAEDELRRLERLQQFGQRFIEVARSVYQANDQRAALKRRINELLGSTLMEEKSHGHLS